MTAQQQHNENKEDELILFDNVLVPNIDNELVFGLGEDSYMNSNMDWDGANLGYNESTDAENIVVEDPDHEELQTLLLDINDDVFPSNTFQGETGALQQEDFSRGNLKQTECGNKSPSFEITTQQTSPDHAREARRQRMEIILRRRGLLGRTRSKRQNNAAADHAVKALLNSNSQVALEDVQHIAQQLVMNMNITPVKAQESAMPRSVSFAEGSELVCPPSPVLSATAVKPKRTGRRSRGDFPVPDETTSSYTPRASSVPPRKKAPMTPRSRKKTSDVDPTLLPDGDDPESRRQRRLIRNRMSAQLHRERKREAMDALQRMIQERDVQIQSLEQQLTQVHKKNTSLEEAMNVIRQHFGAKAIESIIIPGAAPVSPVPNLVHQSSDSSSSDDDENSTSSAPASPIPAMTYTNAKKRTNVTIPTATAVLQPQANPAKKKKLMNAVMMAPLCVCAIIGCLSVNPFKNQVSTVNEIQPRPYRQRISSKSYIPTENTDARRRLLSVKSNGESLLDQILGDTSTHHLQDWVINPVEKYPAQWKIDSGLKYPTPWSYDSQELLFDFRSHALSKTLHSFDFLQNDQPEEKENKSKLRGTPKEEYIHEEIEDDLEHSETSIISLSQAIAISDTANNPPKEDKDVTKAGSNYLFCPSAHAKFTPDFLKLSKFGRDAVTEDIDQDFEMDEHEEQTESSQSKALVPANSYKRLKNDKFIFKAEGEDPYMSILLPASAVSGGSVTPRRDEPWIELGCQVLSAKIVNGVDFFES